MRPARLAACAAAVAALAVAPAATAGAPACNLVVDPRGDARTGDLPPGVYASPDQDIVGADIASNKRHLTAVVRLASLRELDTDAPTGRSYVVEFTVAGKPYSLHATYGPDGYQGVAWDDATGSGLGNASVVLDHQQRQVRITAPAALFGAVPGRTVAGITAKAGHRYGTNAPKAVPAAAGYGAYVGGAGADSVVDTATTSRTYVAGSASCVTPAR
ncbi:MAG TPA: hypothetical protein VGX28_01765 [Frankiaceae bacterium]|jgi:hypothetical protein|nr:hypothetical protein [Frankiaceae bacterium]